MGNKESSMKYRECVTEEQKSDYETGKRAEGFREP